MKGNVIVIINNSVQDLRPLSVIRTCTVEPSLYGPRLSGFLDYPDLLLWSHFFVNIYYYRSEIKTSIVSTNFDIQLMFFWYLLLCISSLNTVFFHRFLRDDKNMCS